MQVKNKSSREKVESRFWPVIEEAIGVYKNLFGNELVAVYLQGSVGRGEYVDGISDVDTLAYVKQKPTNEQIETLEKSRKEIISHSPWLTKIDIVAIPIEQFYKNPLDQFKIATDSLLLWGDELKPTVDFPEVGPQLARFLNRNFSVMLTKQEQAFAGCKIPNLKVRNRVIAKKALRLSLGLVMTKEDFYSQTINEITPKVKEVLPELSEVISRIEQVRQNPQGTADEFKQLLIDCRSLAENAQSLGVAGE